MSSFAMVLLEGGLDLEVVVDFAELTSLLDEDVAGFSCGEYIYKVTAGKGTLGRRWIFLINAMDPQMEGQPLIPLGRIEVEPITEHVLHICVPPRMDQAVPGLDAADWDGRLFGAFIFQLLNSLQAKKLIDLPGVLPTV